MNGFTCEYQLIHLLNKQSLDDVNTNGWNTGTQPPYNHSIHILEYSGTCTSIFIYSVNCQSLKNKTKKEIFFRSEYLPKIHTRKA